MSKALFGGLFRYTKKEAHQGGTVRFLFIQKRFSRLTNLFCGYSACGSADRDIGKFYPLVGAVESRSADYIIILQDYQLYHSRFKNFFHVFPPVILVEFTLETACLICICKVESGNAVFISATGKLACLIVFILL